MKNYFDLYAVPVNFTYRNYYLFPSICGGIMSLIVEILLLAYLIYLLVDMSTREFPDLGISTLYEHSPQSIAILTDPSYSNSENIPFEINKELTNQSYWYVSFGVKNPKSSFEYPIPENILHVTVNEMTLKGGTIYDKKLTPSKCKKFGNGFVSQETFDSLDLGKTECINGGYTFQGVYGYEGAQWLEITVKETGTGTPETSAENYKFEFYYQSRNLNITNFSDDISVSIVEEVFWDLLVDKTRIATLKLGMDKIETNDRFLPRFIYRLYQFQYALTAKKWIDQTKAKTDKQLLIIRIYLDRLTLRTERAFPDFISQFAMVGGLTGIAFPVGFLFVFVIRNFKMNESMMNDCYSIVDPKKKASLDPFDEFLIRHYNKLMRKFEEMRATKQTKKSDDEGIGLKRNTTTEANNKDNMTVQFTEETKKNVLIEINDDLSIDEGLIDPTWNGIEKFFTLRRIEDLFNLTYNDRLKAIQETQSFKPKKQKTIDFIDDALAAQHNENIDFSKVKQAEFLCYQFLYESCIYKVQEDFKFNIIELIQYFIFEIFCCKKKKEIDNQMIAASSIRKTNSFTTDHNKSIVSISTTKVMDKRQMSITNSDKKFAVYNGAKKKLGIDFDLINILKTIEGFDYFTQVFFDDSQQILFNSVAKPTIRIDTVIEDQLEPKEQEFADVKEMYSNLVGMFNDAKGKLEPYQIRLFELMGRSSDEIDLVQKLLNGEDIKDKFDHWQNKSETTNNKNDKDIKDKPCINEKDPNMTPQKNVKDNDTKEEPMTQGPEMQDFEIEKEIDAMFNKAPPDQAERNLDIKDIAANLADLQNNNKYTNKETNK